MKVALIHDFLLQYGGAERVLETLITLYPDAQIYTLCYDPRAFPVSWQKYSIHSLMPKLPGIGKYPQFYAPWLVAALHRIPLGSFDLVISSDMLFAKMVLCPPSVTHICYSYSPSDMLYHFLPHHDRRLTTYLLTAFQKSFLRRQDYLSAQLPDVFICLSEFVGKRIKKYYKREYRVIYPPVVMQPFVHPQESGEYYLLVARLVPHKNIEIAVRCCTAHQLPLVVLGNGPELARLRSIAGPTVTFVTDADDGLKNDYYTRCKALVICNEEDFGITPVEALSFGRGVIGYGRGGIRETVKEGVTGVYFNELTEQSLYDALIAFDSLTISPEVCRQQAEKFSADSFADAFRAVIDEVSFKRVV